MPEAKKVPYAIIHNFVKATERPRVRQPLGDLVTIGALQPTKRNQFMIETVAAAKRMGQTLTLDIYGEGPLRLRLEETARELGLEAQIRFRGFRSDVRTFLGGYRACIHACPTETGPISIIEGMAAGLPIVAPGAGGARELFDDGVEGRYCSVDDPAQAAETVLGVLGDEEAHSKYAAAARDRFNRDFDVEVIGPRLHSFLTTGAT
jgi:glycosyltransferase involved in cell wall biosynthesis